MEAFPTISRNEGIVKVSFGDIPVWNGVQKSPGVQKCLPFELSTKQSQIMQYALPKVINGVIDAYEEDDYKFITHPPGSSDWANFLGENKVKAVEKVIDAGAPPRNILEIGAGSEWVASNLQKKYNPDSYVIVDPTIKESSKKTEIIRGYFPNSKIADRRFDLIVGFSVLEHMADPVLFLNNIKKHLTSDGIVVLAYPDCEAQILKGDINVIGHEHLSYFTEASSRWLASNCGFEVMLLESENDCFTLVLSQGSKNLGRVEVLDESEILIKSVESFQNLFGAFKEKIVEHLAAGETIGFHGATSGLNIFLYVTGLGGHSNIYIYDADRSKVGMYLPACLSPIMHHTDSSYSTHSLMIVASDSFFEQISIFAINEVGIDGSRLISLVGLDSLD